ncbi:10858_t:CDS:2 [Cetraspora pellucida]|uniref:10858_t:CDS:1 n=1 Tax=Cetraspora pellucida TaxID=1433469 RepID=A0A9N9AMN8_9GLOM|nr:10858_t:CDS:2 [Cetraspora pellucida]
MNDLRGLPTSNFRQISSKIDNPMDVREFVDIDTNVAFEMPSDDDIICNIRNKDDHLTKEEILELALKITDYNALKALDLIKIYLLQQPDNFIATDNDRNTVRKLKRRFYDSLLFEKSRLTLLNFFAIRTK